MAEGINQCVCFSTEIFFKSSQRTLRKLLFNFSQEVAVVQKTLGGGQGGGQGGGAPSSTWL